MTPVIQGSVAPYQQNRNYENRVTYLFKVLNPNNPCLVSFIEVVCELVLNKFEYWKLGALGEQSSWSVWVLHAIVSFLEMPLCFYIALQSVDSSCVTWQFPGIDASSNRKKLGRVKLFWKAESCWKVIPSVTENELEQIELEPWKGFPWNWGACGKRIALNVRCAGIELSSRNWRLGLACCRLCLH